jgi:uncharacterized protein
MATSGSSNPMKPSPVGSRRCPICGKPAAARHQPFCSARCANIDLGRWFKGSYAVETEDAPEDPAERDED